MIMGVLRWTVKEVCLEGHHKDNLKVIQIHDELRLVPDKGPTHLLLARMDMILVMMTEGTDQHLWMTSDLLEEA